MRPRTTREGEAKLLLTLNMQSLLERMWICEEITSWLRRIISHVKEAKCWWWKDDVIRLLQYLWPGLRSPSSSRISSMTMQVTFFVQPQCPSLKINIAKLMSVVKTRWILVYRYPTDCWYKWAVFVNPIHFFVFSGREIFNHDLFYF